jgi:hypothetical protein
MALKAGFYREVLVLHAQLIAPVDIIVHYHARPMQISVVLFALELVRLANIKILHAVLLLIDIAQHVPLKCRIVLLVLVLILVPRVIPVIMSLVVVLVAQVVFQPIVTLAPLEIMHHALVVYKECT